MRRLGGGDGGGNGAVDTSALPFRPQYSSRTTNMCGYLSRNDLNSFCGPTYLRTSDDDWDAWPATDTIGSQSSSRLLICLRKKAIASCSISFIVLESYCGCSTVLRVAPPPLGCDVWPPAVVIAWADEDDDDDVEDEDELIKSPDEFDDDDEDDMPSLFTLPLPFDVLSALFVADLLVVFGLRR